MRLRKNPKRDWRSSRGKWADTTRATSLHLYQVHDILKSGATMTRIGTEKPVIGVGKHLMAVPIAVFNDLKTHDLICILGRKKINGRWMFSYGINNAPMGGLAAVIQSRENHHRITKRPENETKSLGKLPFET